jgi:hypothetical protein
MRRSMLLAMATVLVMVVAACGTSGGGSGGSSIVTAEELKAAFEEAGATCEDPTPYEEDDDSLGLGVEPSEELACKIDGLELGALFFAEESDRKAALAVAQAFICGFGAPGFPHLASGPWFAGIESDLGDEEEAAASAAALKKVADSLGLEVQGEKCPEGSGPDFGGGDSGDDDEEEEPTRTGPGASKGEALPLGEAAEIGDYSVRLIEVDADALDAVLAANEFNDPPGNGRYVVFTFEATYLGDEEGSPGIDLTTVFSGGDAVQYRSSDCLASLGGTFGLTLENGGSGTVTDCFDVPAEAVDGGAIFIEAFFGFGDDADRTYWALD